MTLNDLLFEKDMAALASDFEKAEKELNKDINERITLDKIKEFVRKWKYFTDKFNVSKKRITEIEATGRKLLKFLQKKVDDLEAVKVFPKDEIKPMRDYLADFSNDIDMHVEIQTELYKKMNRK